jgi:tetratricopeptide (TPR) repeat protein
MDLTYFNPNLQNECDFLCSFVARHSTLEFFLKQLQLVRITEAARHHLIVAPRGFGKTSLLRRIAIGVRQDENLRTRFIALRFREEQHNVISLDVFWRNCLQSLTEAREDEGAPASEIDVLDAIWASHGPRQALAQDDQDGELAWEALRAHCEQLQRRPLLLIDNFDTLLAGLSASHQWSLRKRLQSDDGPILIAAASRYPTATHDPNAAFYEFFRVYPLDKLEDQEVFTCLRNIALRRGTAGQPVLALLDKDPGRVAALNTLAGGNPRTLSVLYGVLESHMSADVLSQLSAMLDTFTGWYQARTEELPIQARAVFDALALNWDPMTAAALGQTTGLDTTAVSSQLTRLEKAGYVERVALSKRGKGRNGYQVSERFFNIWYLMRNGPRRAKQRILFLTTFLQSCFSPAERRSLALAVLKNCRSDPGYTLALARSMGNSRLREQLLDQAYTQSNDTGQADEYVALIEGLRNERRRQRRTGQSEIVSPEAEKKIRSYDDVIARFGSATELALRERVAKALVSKGLRLGAFGQSEQAIAVYDDVIARFGSATEIALREQVAKALFSKGLRLGAVGQSEQAIAVYDDVIARFGSATEPALRESVARALFNKGLKLRDLGQSEQAIAVYDDVIARFGSATEIALREQVAKALFSKGFRLGVLGQSEQAIAVYDDVIARFGSATELALREQVAKALINKGFRLGMLNQSEQAIAVYDDVITRFDSATELSLREHVARALFNKGLTLGALGQSEQAIAAYDDIIDRFDSATEPNLREQVARALFNKGFRLGVLGQSELAIAIYDNIITRFSTATEPTLREYVAKALFNKSVRLELIDQPEQAIVVYDDIIARYGLATEPALRESVARALFNKGVRFDVLGQSEQAIAAYDDVITRFGSATELALRQQVAKALFSKGFRLGVLGQSELAIAAYDDVITRFGSATESSLCEPVARALFNKGVRLDVLGQSELAIAAYDDVITRFGSATESSLREPVARALFNKGLTLNLLDQPEQAIAVYDDIIDRFGSATEPALREQVAKALFNKGVMLVELGQSEQAIRVYDDVISRFSTATELTVREQVAKALVNKGFSLDVLSQSEAAIAVYDDIIARFSTATEPALREQVANALQNKATSLLELHRFDASESTYRAAIEWQPTSCQFHIGLGNLLLDFMGDPTKALTVYKNGIEVAKDPEERAVIHANIAYTLALHDGDRVAARAHATSALEDRTSVSLAGQRLLAALPIWNDRLDADWHHIFENVGAAVTCEDPALWTNYQDDLQRLLCFVLTRGQGLGLKHWMDDAQFSNRYAPLYHAFVAALESEDYLLRINPETRQPALKIFSGIARRISLYDLGNMKLRGDKSV